MKKFLSYLLTGLAVMTFATKAEAQANITWEQAQQITPGEEVVSQFTPGQTEALWYKVAMTQGNWYEIPYPSYPFNLSYAAEGMEYSGQGWYDYGFNDYPDFRAMQFQAPETGTLYICVNYKDRIGETFTWMFEEITDNRVHTYAQPITVGQEANVEVGQIRRWFKVTLPADKYYVSETTSTSVFSVDIYKGPDSNNPVGYLGSVFHTEEAGEYYITTRRYYFDDPSSVTSDISFSLREVEKENNTSIGNALLMPLDQEMEFSLVFGDELYFKANLESGKKYEVIAGSEEQFRDILLEITDAAGTIVPTEESFSPKGVSRTFTVYETGEYYIKRSKLPYGYSEGLAKMTLSVVNDLRSSSQAAPVTFGQPVTYNHKEYGELWWKLNLKQGSYWIDFTNNSDHGSTLEMYSAEILDKPQDLSDKSFTFICNGDGVYYLKSHNDGLRQYDWEADNHFTITEVVDLQNTDIASAFPIEVGDVMTANYDFGNKLWYKVSVPAGETYELSAQEGPWGKIRMEVFDIAVSETEPIATNYYTDHAPQLYLTPAEDITYYICFEKISSDSQPFTWTFKEVTDNRIKKYATPIVFGHEYQLTPENAYPNNEYWYRLDAKAGKFYEVDFTDAEIRVDWGGGAGKDRIYVLDNNGNYIVDPITKSNYLLAAKKDQTIFFKLQRENLPVTKTLTWKMEEKSQGDNRLSEYAQTIELGQDLVAKHFSGKYVNQWYKITLQKDKIYEVSLDYAANDILYYKGEVPGKPREETVISKNRRGLIQPEETETYYFLSSNTAWYELRQDFTWNIKEVEGDNRLPDFAEEVTLGEEFTIPHEIANVRWYKADLEEGNLYSVQYYADKYGVEVYFKQDGQLLRVYGESSRDGILFSTKYTGTHYFKFEAVYSSDVDCTISAVTDNRSCQYAVGVGPNEIAEGQSITKEGLWYAVNLEANGYYEFDFTQLPSNITGQIFTDCADDKVLIEGRIERIMIKAKTTGTYLVHLIPSYESGDATFSWLYTEFGQGDSRLAEYALSVTEDTTRLVVDNGIKRFWYTYELQAGKYYKLGCDNGLVISTYKNADDEMPQSVVRNAKVFEAKATETIYLQVFAENDYAEGEYAWYIHEIQPDGLFPEHPIPVKVNEDVVSTTEQGMFEYYDWSPGPVATTIWYHFIPDETAIYELDFLNFVVPSEENNWYSMDYYCQLDVYNNLLPDTMEFVTGCAHIYDRPTTRFKGVANTDYLIRLYNFERTFSSGTDRLWTIRKTDDLNGQVFVYLYQQDGRPLEAPGANLILYQKVNNTIEVADTLKASPVAHFNVYESRKDLEQGTYLLYADKLGTGTDNKRYLAGWHEQADTWEQATEIVLDSDLKRFDFTPKAAPDDIFEGLVTISGQIIGKSDEGTTSMDNVDICILRQIEPEPMSKAITRESTPHLQNWEIVARTKSDENGYYEVDNLVAGVYKVMVDLPGYAGEDAGIIVDALSGETDYSNNNFEADQATRTIKSKPLGISAETMPEVKLYPNPFTTHVVVENAKGARVQIFSSNGMCVFSKTLSGESETLPLQQLSAGFYIFSVEKDGSRESTIMIKK